VTEPHHKVYSPSSRADVKNAWRCISTTQSVFMTWCLVKRRGSFNFTFTIIIIHSAAEKLAVARTGFSSGTAGVEAKGVFEQGWRSL
jgi:hypothetical protein